jgi:hypothetical protein
MLDFLSVAFFCAMANPDLEVRYSGTAQNAFRFLFH